MDGQTDVRHINLIGRLVTRNPPKNDTLQLYQHGTGVFIVLLHLLVIKKKSFEEINQTEQIYIKKLTSTLI